MQTGIQTCTSLPLTLMGGKYYIPRAGNIRAEKNRVQRKVSSSGIVSIKKVLDAASESFEGNY
jgi:hypothetical protein